MSVIIEIAGLKYIIICKILDLFNGRLFDCAKLTTQLYLVLKKIVTL